MRVARPCRRQPVLRGRSRGPPVPVKLHAMRVRRIPADHAPRSRRGSPDRHGNRATTPESVGRTRSRTVPSRGARALARWTGAGVVDAQPGIPHRAHRPGRTDLCSRSRRLTAITPRSSQRAGRAHGPAPIDPDVVSASARSTYGHERTREPPGRPGGMPGAPRGGRAPPRRCSTAPAAGGVLAALTARNLPPTQPRLRRVASAAHGTTLR